MLNLRWTSAVVFTKGRGKHVEKITTKTTAEPIQKSDWPNVQRHIKINIDTDTYGLSDRQKAMTHPAPCGSITTNVGKTLFVIPVWSTERNFFYGLVNNHALKQDGIKIINEIISNTDKLHYKTYIAHFPSLTVVIYKYF